MAQPNTISIAELSRSIAVFSRPPDSEPHHPEASLERSVSSTAPEMAPSAAATPAAPARGGAQTERTNLSRADFGKIVDWLEVPENFSLLHGTSSRLAVGERHPSKKTVHQLMLVTLHSKGFPSFVKTGDNLGKRLGRYIAKYKETLLVKNDSGQGLTLADMRAGVTMEEKLDKLCPHFARMHEIFGHRPNVDPHALSAAGMPNVPDVYHERLLDDDSSHDQSPTDDTVGDRGSSQVDIQDIDMECSEAANLADTQQNEASEYEEELNLPFDDSPLDETEQLTANTTRPGNVLHPSVSTPNPAEDSAPSPSSNCGPAPPSTPSPTPTPAPTPQRSTSASQPAAGPPSNASRRVPIKRALSKDSQGTSRSNPVADLYLEKITDKSVFRKQMVDAKDKWVSLELGERRDARLSTEALTKAAQSAAKTQAKLQRRHEEKKQRIDLQHSLSVLYTTQTFGLLNCLFNSNRPKAEIEDLMKMVPGPVASSLGTAPTENREARQGTPASEASPSEDEIESW